MVQVLVPVEIVKVFPEPNTVLTPVLVQGPALLVNVTVELLVPSEIVTLRGSKEIASDRVASALLRASSERGDYSPP